MSHWSDKYLGRPYLRGTQDCAHLLVTVQQAEFGRTVRLPQHAAGVRARDAQMAALTAALTRPLTAGECPQDGDAALMRAAGRRLSLGHHVGIIACLPGAPCVLHCQAGVGTVRHPLTDLARRRLELTGVYRWL